MRGVGAAPARSGPGRHDRGRVGGASSSGAGGGVVGELFLAADVPQVVEYLLGGGAAGAVQHLHHLHVDDVRSLVLCIIVRFKYELQTFSLS